MLSKAFILLFLSCPAFAGLSAMRSSTNNSVNVGGSNIIGSITSGATFYALAPRSNVVLRKICTTIIVAGVIGGGDSVVAALDLTNTLTVTSAAGATAGTVTCASGTLAVTAGSTIFIRMDSTATTRPIVNFNLEYTAQ